MKKIWSHLTRSGIFDGLASTFYLGWVIAGRNMGRGFLARLLDPVVLVMSFECSFFPIPELIEAQDSSLPYFIEFIRLSDSRIFPEKIRRIPVLGNY